MKVLGISGKRGSGKDTLFKSLRMNRVMPHIYRIGFADPIKEWAIKMHDVPREVAYGDSELRERKIPFGEGTVRDLLKVVGFAAAQYDQRVFAREGMRLANLMKGIGFFPIITDVRFPYEVDEIQAAGGKVVRLTRIIQHDGSVSETALDDFKRFDFVVDNQSLSAAETYQRVAQWIKKEVR